jgi:hypothetical protein
MKAVGVWLFCVSCAGFAQPGILFGQSAAGTEGRELAAQLCQQRPETNSVFQGVLQVRDAAGHKTEVAIAGKISVTDSNWQTVYETRPATNQSSPEIFIVTSNGTNRYELQTSGAQRELDAKELFAPFAGSDFWRVDLGLDFFHWPTQRLLKKELRRGQGCAVLESVSGRTNAPAYFRVVSWVDLDTGGIVHADAYDVYGKRIKEFEPKEFKKVHGRWELQEMEIRNLQTGSRTKLRFDLKPVPAK